jgi:hypothetical protein
VECFAAKAAIDNEREAVLDEPAAGAQLQDMSFGSKCAST